MPKVKNIKNIVFLILIAICIIVVIFFVKKVTVKKYINENIKFVEKDINPNDFIKDRCYSLKDNILYIGRNEKELDNKFYDIEISYTKQAIKIGFNKIYKEEYSSEIYVDENYLCEVLCFINKKYSLELQDIIMQEMIVLIKDRYMDFRTNKESKILNCNNINSKLKYEFLEDKEKGILFFSIS